MAIQYDPAFTFTDWIDNQSRVKAGGDDGFNRRFHDIEDEFHTISDTVGDIKDAIDALAQTPTPTLVLSTLTPTLVPVGDPPWDHVTGAATKRANLTAATGMLGLVLPHGSTLRSMRVVGRNTGAGVISITLRRSGIAAGSASEVISSATGAVTPGQVTFDNQGSAPAGTLARVDSAQFRYYVLVELNSAAPNDTVQVTAIQIGYAPS
jgi:hypothetical protein